MTIHRRGWLALAVAGFAIAASGLGPDANAQQKRLRFAYDQPKPTGYGVAGDVFHAKLMELSKGAMGVDQYPGAQLGQEPQLLQMLKSGDLDFAITSTANTATVSPQAGVFSLHFLFRNEDHLKKSLADPAVAKAVRTMIEETLPGGHALALATLGLHYM
jgi:TRAP-type transport system periplasmic protein